MRKIVRAIGLACAAAAVMAAQALGQSADNGSTVTYGDWQYKCEAGGADQSTRCYILYSAVVPATKTRILQMAVALEGPNQGPIAILTAPLGVQLEEGLLLQIDDGKTTRLPFKICAPGGCIAPEPLNTARLNELKRGVKLLVGFYNTAGELVAVPVSLKGFTAAYDALR